MTPREGPTLRVAAGALPPGAASAPAAYFIKDSPTDVLRREDDMEARVHFGALASSGPSLDALEQLIKHVFMPLFGANEETGADAEETGGARRRYAAAKEKGPGPGRGAWRMTSRSRSPS